MTNLIVRQLLAEPPVSYTDEAHPFERYASEDLEVSDGIACLADDLNASIVQEGLEDLRLSFFGKGGFNRPDVEWLFEWFWKYADAVTGLGEFDEAEWDDDDEEEEQEQEQEQEDDQGQEGQQGQQEPM